MGKRRGGSLFRLQITAVADCSIHAPYRIVGDVDFEAVQSIAGAITPMPGGTGPMTIGCLLENTVEAARRASTAGKPRRK